MLRRKFTIYVYLGLGLVLAIGAVLGITAIAANRENENSRVTQADVVKYETDHILTALSGKLTTMIYWQDAYDKAAASWDQKWVAYQFGPYLNAIDINIVAMFDAQGHLLFRYTHGMDHSPTSSRIGNNVNVRELFDLVRKVRTVQPPIVKTAVIDLDGTPYFAVAGIITPETDKELPIPDNRKRVVVFLTHATDASYATLVKSFNVSGLRIAMRIPDNAGFASMALNDANNDIATRVWWRPARPGSELMAIVIPLSILVFLLLAATQYVIVRNWQSLQRELFRVQAKAEGALEESRAKSAFLGTISHELRTPLNAIIGFSDAVLSKMFGELNAQCEEYIGYIRAGGLTLLDKVNDLIEIARIEAHDTALERMPTDANELVTLALSKFREEAKNKKIVFVFAPNDDSCWCLSAPLSLQKVLSHILSNSVKFSRPGSIVEIAVGRRAESITIAICDHGIGIGAHDLKNLGRPFAQVEGHLARQNGGVGLGLAISNGLMRLMDGTLDITSEFGAGTTVTLRLPAITLPSELPDGVVSLHRQARTAA